VGFAKTWPELRVLCCQSWTEVLPHPTLEALYQVVVLCPQLRELELPFAGSHIPTENRPLQQHSLKTLNIGWFNIKKAAILAECLLRLFPDLENLTSNLRISRDTHQGWETGGREEPRTPHAFDDTAQLDVTMEMMQLCRRVVGNTQMADHNGRSSELVSKKSLLVTFY
jgi:hypothetical protein